MKSSYLKRKYVFDLLSETGKLGAKSCSSPMAPGVHLTREGELFEDPERYRRFVRKLNYLTVTRPDIAHSVSVVSQYMSSPTVDNLAVVEHILCYLKGAPGRDILYSNHGHNRVECFTGVDWAGSKEDRRSTSGYCVFVVGNLVSWKSKKQGVVSYSSAKLEYKAMTQSVCEMMWLHQLLMEVSIKTVVPAKLWCDNQAALVIRTCYRDGGELVISHLLYADDTIIFCEANSEQLMCLRWTLMWFEAFSGLKINLNKSVIIPLGRVDNVELLAAELGCGVGSLPTTYLGLPLGAPYRAVGIWDSMEEIFRKRLSSWKRQYISKGGRLTLIRSSLSSLPIYFLSLFRIPKSVCSRLEKIQRDFLWGGGNLERKLHLVNWKTVCQEKS